jgi:hypothetical protein
VHPARHREECGGFQPGVGARTNLAAISAQTQTNRIHQPHPSAQTDCGLMPSGPVAPVNECPNRLRAASSYFVPNYYSEDDPIPQTIRGRFVTIAAHSLDLDPPALLPMQKRMVANLQPTAAVAAALSCNLRPLPK